MVAQPRLFFDRRRPRCRLSIILLDWGVRESFHSLHYLNRQTVGRDVYEILWLEYYQRRPAALEQMIHRDGPGAPLVDLWLAAGYPDNHIFHKHRLYNIGLLLAQGQYVVFCDSDAIFTPTFVEKILRVFDETPRCVIHLDEIRNTDRRFYPFRYPALGDILGAGCLNWRGTVSRGLEGSRDLLHDLNYGACMAAPRDELMAVGGADEHLDYLGYVCGPYEMTFRLVNRGLPERWLRDEYLYHVWHPNESGINTDYQGPHDGMGISLRALEARALGRVAPWVENPWIGRNRLGEPQGRDQLLAELANRPEPAWRSGCQPDWRDTVFCTQCNYLGFNLFCWRRRWYGLKVDDGGFDPKHRRRYRPFIQARRADVLRQLIAYYNALPRSWWGRLWAQPLYTLPLRLAHRVRCELARLF